MEKYKYCITPTSSLEYTITLCYINLVQDISTQCDAYTLYAYFFNKHIASASVQCQCTYLVRLLIRQPGSQLDTAISRKKSILNIYLNRIYKYIGILIRNNLNKLNALPKPSITIILESEALLCTQTNTQYLISITDTINRYRDYK